MSTPDVDAEVGGPELDVEAFVVDAQPAVAAANERLRDVEARKAALIRVNGEAQYKFRIEHDAWKAEREAALNRGRVPKQKPEPQRPISEGEYLGRLRSLEYEAEQIVLTRRRAVADSREAVEREVAAICDRLTAEAGPHAKALERLAGEFYRARSALEEVTEAEEQISGTRRIGREPQPITAESVMGAVLNGHDPMLGVAPGDQRLGFSTRSRVLKDTEPWRPSQAPSNQPAAAKSDVTVVRTVPGAR